jgi:hypothetical protein
MHELLFFEVSPHCSATSRCRRRGLARTLPSSTRRCVTLPIGLPFRLPWLVVVSLLVAPILLCRCLSTRSLHLLPPIRLSFSPAGCRVNSYCTASRCLSLRRRLSTTRWLVVTLPLVVLPPPCVSSPHAMASCNVRAGWCVTSHHAALLFA